MSKPVGLAAHPTGVKPAETSAPAPGLQLIASAAVAISGLDRQATDHAARSICVLALLDAIDPDSPMGTAGAAVLQFVRTASANSLAVLLEPTQARDAHPIVSALARAGVIDPGIAQRAHLLIDLRSDPG